MANERQQLVMMDMPDLSSGMAKAYGQFVALVAAQPYSNEGWAEQAAKGIFDAWVSQQAEHGHWLYYHEKEKAKSLVVAS